ncbi:hypothetical protein P43SY_004519 [Pythium insidiosum]|uniref:Glutamate carboxypeptidase n=1 Tax=Pythium insidiosum TaxID=114742 RepID=A0AAD5M2T1_PYTIN|nr:hypothetical protein P43SY_004519 [Pythium insidiosum]
MMSLASPRRKSAVAPPPIQTADARSGAAYGTFHGDGDEQPFLAPPQRLSPRGQRAPRGRQHGALTKSQSAMLRVVGVAAVLLFAASYLVTQYQPKRAGHLDDAHLLRRSKEHETLENSKTTKLAAGPKEEHGPRDAFERAFLDGVDTEKLKEYLHAYASKPHIAGSQQDYETVLYTAKKLKEFGIKAEIKEYYTLLSLPKRRRAAIVAPESAARELDLDEGSVNGDACTTDQSAEPPFLAYAAPGNVTAPVVYVNYGTPADFKWLEEQGVELKGKIALVRYGRNFRGLKVMLAEQHGMSGVFIYSDPQDDGFGQGKTYPDGPWRPTDSFQRGSTQYLSLYGGDPLTPGFASTIEADRLSVEEATAIPHIPALPLSYGQAKYILASLKGTRAPNEWQGGLELDGGYNVGDDDATVVTLDLDIDNSIGPIWDVIGTIEGDVEPDQIVLIGNHRDAWVCGAVDPSSGSSAMLEIARGFGELLNAGWRPRRTIKLASWDGEEYGLLGSTEYAEDNKDMLLEKAVAYINVDNAAGPYASASAAPSIAQFVVDTACAVPPNRFLGDSQATSFASLYDQWISTRVSHPLMSDKLTLAPDHLIYFMGSGTDFTAFYQHLGIISANLGFSQSAAMYGVYHSTMDSLAYVENFADPRYATQASTAQWWGLMTMRLASDPLLPFDFSTYGLVMHNDLTDFETQTKARGLDIDYSFLREAINHYSANAELFHARLKHFSAQPERNETIAAAWNNRLVRLERQFIADEGLPHRPWYRHVIFGPGFFEGYAGTAFPGISDAIAFNDDMKKTQQHVDRVAQIVQNAAEALVAPAV